MRRTKRESVMAGKWIYVIVGILVIVLLVLILGKVLGGSDDSKKEDVKISTTEEDIIDRVREELREEVTPELDELIQQYYTAMSSCDISTLEQIVSTISDEEKDIIRRKKDYIEAYNNVGVYAKSCPDKNSYLVFTEYDIKFKNEETMVPGLETFYVKKSESGSLCIYKGNEIEPEVEEFITEQLAGKDVQALIREVNDCYIDALASSETLLKFVEGFGGDMTLIEEAKARVAEQKGQPSSGSAATAKATTKPAQTTATKAPAQTAKPAQTSATKAPVQTVTPKPTQAAATKAPAQTATPKPAQATNTNEEVLIIASVNLRKGNDEKAERITTMIVGDKATRISITDNGWSKVKYNGTEGYVKSDYVTTYKVTGDKVKTTTTINVRTEASENANMAGQIPIDTTITRHASCNNGWSQIEYDGSIGYVKTQYLSE